jgi:hypothetical protein
MSYPDYTNEESLRVTPVVDVISDLTAAVNLRVRNMNIYGYTYCYNPVYAYGYPNRQIPELPDLTTYPTITALQMMQALINNICSYCCVVTDLGSPQVGNMFKLDYSLITRLAGYPNGYIDYAFQPCRAEIFIQLKRVIEQLKYFDAGWYMHFDTSTSHLYKVFYSYDLNRPYTTFDGKDATVVSLERGDVHLSPGSSTSNIPFNIALYYVQHDTIRNIHYGNYVDDYWTDMWDLGPTGFMYAGYYTKGSSITVPIRYPNLQKAYDKLGSRYSELHTAALCDISVDYTI